MVRQSSISVVRPARIRRSPGAPANTFSALWMASLFLVSTVAFSQQVNWLDPLAYAKPAPVFINKPNEATVTNKYWIDLSGGSGGTCSQAAPCGDFDSVLGKPGTTGGPAIIYVKGTGPMSWFNDTIYGSGNADCRTSSCASWILIRTWPAGSPGCAAECTATITGNSNLNSSNVNHIMWDGGPDLKIRFHSNVAGTYAQNINSSWHIVYRTQTYCSAAKTLGFQVGATTVADHVYFINNEFHSCLGTGDQASSIYWGPGNGGGYTNALIQGNIIREWGGEGIEVNPRVTSNGMQIIGNVLRDNGSVTCGTAWKCRPHIVMSVQSGGGNNNTFIANNVMWNSWSGCIWNRGGGSPAAIIVNNTCYNYNLYGVENDNNPNPEGIHDGGTSTVVRNNIIYASNGTNPFDTAYTASHNVCGSGKSCGSSPQAWSAAGFVSTSPSVAGFLQPSQSSMAYDKGTVVASVTTDFSGRSRPAGGAYDIGAFEVDSGPRPNPPSAVIVQ
jgi:hypothetical protein